MITLIIKCVNNSSNMRFIKVFIAVFIVIVSTSNVETIVDAYLAYAGSFPHHAAITGYRSVHEPSTITVYQTWNCNGAIISRKHIVTTYKCVTGDDFDGSFVGTTFHISAGCNPISEACTTYNSNKTPKFTPEQIIALIQVTSSEQMIFSDRIQPAMLPKRDTIYRQFAIDRNPNIVYHVSSYPKKELWYLPYLHMKIANITKCIESLPANKIHISALCLQEASYNNKGYTNGSLCSESGAPLVRWTDSVLVGDVVRRSCSQEIISTVTLIGIFDTTNCTARGPNLFIKMEYYVDWIVEQIKLE